MPRATLHVGDLLTVAGIHGIHRAITGPYEPMILPGHSVIKIQLAPGTRYGAREGGDILPVEAYRCALARPDGGGAVA